MTKRKGTTIKDIGKLMANQNRQCAKCGLSFFGPLGVWFHVDHIQPLSRGGKDTLKNKQLLCVGCHKEKTFHPRSLATTIGSDVFEAAKTKRLRRGKRPSKHPMRKRKGKYKWPKRPMRAWSPK